MGAAGWASTVCLARRCLPGLVDLLGIPPIGPRLHGGRTSRSFTGVDGDGQALPFDRK